MEVFEPFRYVVEVGSTMKHGGRPYNVSNVYVHPKFQGGENNRHHDIGLLELSTEIPIGKTSQYTKLGHKNDKITTGIDGIVSGWGENPVGKHLLI